jgi:hypothetical protein
MSMTTKSRINEDHAVEQQVFHHGIGGNTEDFGERNHQDQAKADRRLGCVRNFARREAIKSKEEVQMKDDKVRDKIIHFKNKRKKTPSGEAKARQATKKQK